MMSRDTTDTVQMSSVEFQQIFLKRLGVWIDQTGGLLTPKLKEGETKKPTKHFNFQEAKQRLFPTKIKGPEKPTEANVVDT